jgi:hypothetical protein
VQVNKFLLEILMHNDGFILKNVHVILSLSRKKKCKKKRKKGKKEGHNLSLSFSAKQSKNVLVFYRFIG